MARRGIDDKSSILSEQNRERRHWQRHHPLGEWRHTPAKGCQGVGEGVKECSRKSTAQQWSNACHMRHVRHLCNQRIQQQPLSVSAPISFSMSVSFCDVVAPFVVRLALHAVYAL